MPLSDLRLAVLIDADNVPRRNMKGIMEELAIYGTPTIKRMYGDWTNPSMSSWKKTLLENAIAPIQQYGYTVGKNSTDSAMIIDAMDILYSGRVDGFCLISSDSDFTRLATRLREAGMTVIGVGERKTPNPFIVACDKFIYVEIINGKTAEKQKAEAAKPKPPAPRKKKEEPVKEEAPREEIPKEEPPKEEPAKEEAPRELPAERAVPPYIEELIASSVSALADEDGYTFLGELGNLLLKKQPDFDPRNFGFQKLTPLIRSLKRFELDIRQTNSPHIKHIYVRDRLSQD